MGDQDSVRGSKSAQGEFVVWIPPQTKTVPSGRRTALPRLRCPPSGNGADGSQVLVEDRAVTSMISYELFVEGSEPPTTTIRASAAPLSISRTDMPFVRSGMAGVTEAMSCQVPVLAPVRTKYPDWSSPVNGPPPGPAFPQPVRE